VASCGRPPDSAVQRRVSTKPGSARERRWSNHMPAIWLEAALNLSRWEAMMETDRRFYERRASEEAWAAQRAVTTEARMRHEELLQLYERKARECAHN
jgi:hypothetical protein